MDRARRRRQGRRLRGLLEKAASEGKKGAGQYFTPRVLIQSIVRCMKPDPRAHADFTICDPACGTGGFLVAAYEWLIEQTKGGASTATSPSASERRPTSARTCRPAAAPGADEPLPARPRAAHRARRLDLRGARRRSASTSSSPIRRSAPRARTRPRPRRLHDRDQRTSSSTSSSTS